MYIEFAQESNYSRVWLRAELIERVEPGERKHPTTLILMAGRDTHLEVRGDYRMNVSRLKNLNLTYAQGGQWSDDLLNPLHGG